MPEAKVHAGMRGEKGWEWGRESERGSGEGNSWRRRKGWMGRRDRKRRRRRRNKYKGIERR